jgi:hypothetical protein
MNGLPPDRRRRIGWRWPVAITCVVSLLLVRGAVYYHRAITPPGCTDPRTLALVHDSLTSRFKLPDTTQLENIQTMAGGYLAFRYVCRALLTGFDPHALPPGTMIPHTVHYVSRLVDDGRRQEVSASVAPLLIFVQVQ